MSVLRTRQSGGLEVLRLLRRSIGPPSASCILPALRDGEPGEGDALLLVRRPTVGAQVFASAALAGNRRHSGSRGGFRPWLLRPPPVLVRPPPPAPRSAQRF